MMSLREYTQRECAPKIFAVRGLPDYWVAEATDGRLYMVPNKPGAWVLCDVMQGQLFDGSPEELQPVSSDEARSIMWFVYGDIGSVVIAQG